MSALRRDLAAKGSTLGVKVWPIFAAANWILVVFGCSLVFSLSVMGNDDSFFAELILFLVGAVLSASFGLYVCHRIDKRHKVWGDKGARDGG